MKSNFLSISWQYFAQLINILIFFQFILSLNFSRTFVRPRSIIFISSFESATNVILFANLIQWIGFLFMSSFSFFKIILVSNINILNKHSDRAHPCFILFLIFISSSIHLFQCLYKFLINLLSYIISNISFQSNTYSLYIISNAFPKFINGTIVL